MNIFGKNFTISRGFKLSTYGISSYSCRGNYSFLNSSSEETIQGKETIQGRKLYEELRYFEVQDGQLNLTSKLKKR